jgi:hypothetical protein
MKKSVLMLLAMIVLGTNAVNATALRPLNVQNAKMDTENQNELRVNFDWFRDHSELAGQQDVRSNSFTIPRIDIRHTFDTEIPVRVGMNIGMAVGFAELALDDTEIDESSALGFQNMGLTLEAGVVQEEDLSIALYVNQHFPFVQNNLLLANTYRPIYGANAYGFQTGAEYQFKFLVDNLTWHGDVGYRFDVPEAGEVQNSLVYYNEAVLSLGDDNNIGLSLGLLGNSVYNSNIGTDLRGTDLRIVPGLIIGMGDDNNKQFRVGLPIGLNSDSADLGVQASYFSLF